MLGATDSYLDDSFPRDIGHQEIHGNIFTVHVSIHPVLDVPRHFVGIQVIKVLSHETQNEEEIHKEEFSLAGVYRGKITY